MERFKIIAVLLIIFGLFALTHDRITYTEQEKVVDIGPIQITGERERPVPLLPIFGGIVIIAGLVLLFSRSKGR